MTEQSQVEKKEEIGRPQKHGSWRALALHLLWLLVGVIGELIHDENINTATQEYAGMFGHATTPEMLLMPTLRQASINIVTRQWFRIKN